MSTSLLLRYNLLNTLNILRNIHDSAQLQTPQQAYRDINTPFTFVSCQHFKAANQQLLLLDIFAEVSKASATKLQLNLLGYQADAKYWQTLQARVIALGLSDSVTLRQLTSETELLPLIQASDLYCAIAQPHIDRPLLDAILQYLPIVCLHNSSDTSPNLPIHAFSLVYSGSQISDWVAPLVQLLQQPEQRNAQAYESYQRLGDYYRKQPQYLQWITQKLRHYSSAAQYQSAQQQTLKYRIEGPFDSSYSLALVNRELARALDEQEPEKVGLYATEGPGDLVPSSEFLEANPDIAALQRQALQIPKVEYNLRLLYPPRANNMQGRYNGMNCYGWEESGFPQEYVAQFNQYLQFTTTMSAYVTRVLQDNGVTCPLFTTGIGVDHILQQPVDSTALPVLPEHKLKLLHISSCFPRKGVDVLLQAYGQQFTAADAVCLIIKTFANPHHNIELQVQQWQGIHSDPPEVILINAELPESAIRGLYQAADVLVAPSRGEGFGLPMAEAMLHQLPVITTGYGGQLDFANERTAWLIDYQFARAQSHMQQPNSVWVEPSAVHLRALLGSFYGAYRLGHLSDFSTDKVARASLNIQQHTWQKVAQRTRQALALLPSLPATLPEPKLAVVTTWHAQCGIATYSELLFEHSLVPSVILASHETTLTQADDERVIRCWKAGVEDDLSELQRCILEQDVNQVLIQFNFSFFSLPALQQLMLNLLNQDIQVLLTLHSTADVYWGEELKTLRDLQPALGKIQRIFVHSIADLNNLKRFALIDSVTLFSHGVTRHQPLATADIDSPFFRQEAQVMRDKKVIASYGFLLPHKGIAQLIEAFSLLLVERPDSHLLLVTALYPVDASKQYLRQCQALIKQYQLEKQVTFVSEYLTDAHSRAWLSLAYVIVYPYQQTQESSSAAVRWGIALEKPVLCTPLPIFDDVASAVQLFNGTSATHIATDLNDFLNNPAQLTEKARAQQQWLSEHCWTGIARRLHNVLRSLLQQQRIAKSQR